MITLIVHGMNYPLQQHTDAISASQTDRFQHLIFDLYQCCQQRMQQQSERFDLPEAELRCLRLFGRERYLTPKGIAGQMGVVKSRITKLINGLLEKGLIRRFKDPQDSRISLLRLTPAGQAKLGRINAYLKSANQDVLARMTAEQRDKLLEHLEVLRAAMKTTRGE